MSYSYHTEQFQNDDITFAAWLRPHFKHGKGNSSCMVKATIAAWWRQHFLLGEGNIHIPCLVKGTFLAWWRQYSPPPLHVEGNISCIMKSTFLALWSQHFLHVEGNISCIVKSWPPREFLDPRAKGNLATSSNSSNNDTQTTSTTVCHKQAISTTKMN